MSGDRPTAQAQLKRIRFLGERGMRRASESLTGMLGYTIRLRVTGVTLLAASDLPALAEDSPGEPSVALLVQIIGQGSGRILLLLPVSTVSRVLGVLVGRRVEPRAFTDLERSALQEMGNILASSFLSELGDLTERRLLHSVPLLVLERVPQAIGGLVSAVRALDPSALVVQGRLEDPAGQLRGQVFVVPEIAPPGQSEAPAASGRRSE
jgi:chemotaxis protein CheC